MLATVICIFVYKCKALCLTVMFTVMLVGMSYDIIKVFVKKA